MEQISNLLSKPGYLGSNMAHERSCEQQMVREVLSGVSFYFTFILYFILLLILFSERQPPGSF